MSSCVMVYQKSKPTKGGCTERDGDLVPVQCRLSYCVTLCFGDLRQLTADSWQLELLEACS